MMNTKMYILAVLVYFSFITCAQKSNNLSNQNHTSKQMETLLKPVKALIEAMDAENAEGIRAQFSKKATQAYGADGSMKTPEETEKWIESDIISRQGKVAKPEYKVINDSQVVVTGQYSSKGYTNKANFLFTVEDGLITAWRMRY
jgi:hypothetical protein